MTALAINASSVYVAGSYRGQLNAGNSTSRTAGGVSSYPFVARYDRSLGYDWHLDDELWTDFTSLAIRASGGVLVTGDISDVFAWEDGASGHLVASDRGATFSALSRTGMVDWMRRVGDASAIVRTSGRQVLLGGSYVGPLHFPFSPVAADRNIYVADMMD